MSIKVTVKPQNSVVTSVRTTKTAISSVNIGTKPDLFLGQLRNVEASDPDDGEVLVYDATINKYVVKPVVVDANNITNIAGGFF
jgi:hypothetical protein